MLCIQQDDFVFSRICQLHKVGPSDDRAAIVRLFVAWHVELCRLYAYTAITRVIQQYIHNNIVTNRIGFIGLDGDDGSEAVIP